MSLLAITLGAPQMVLRVCRPSWKPAGDRSITTMLSKKKEMFAKLLQRWSLYSSAQMIFVHISHALHRPERAHGRHYEHTLPNQGPICPRRPGWVEGSHGTSEHDIIRFDPCLIVKRLS